MVRTKLKPTTAESASSRSTATLEPRAGQAVGRQTGRTRSDLFEHTELSGRVLRFPKPAPEVAAFLSRLRAMLDTLDVSPEKVRACAFGPENPILARHPTLPGAYPDAATVRDPAYWVCVDVVLRAEARAAGVSPEKAGTPFTTTISEAATKLGRVQSSIQNAIENRTLHEWVHGTRHYLLPAEVAAYNIPRRGRPPKSKSRE
jgi:hypothetical protein